jgi:hypothetical protein
MTASSTAAAVSRRTALAGLGVGGLGLAFAATARRTAAQDTASGATAGHPLVGVWLAMVPVTPGAPLVPISSIYTADGQIVTAWPVTQAGAQGVTFASSVVGTWEGTGARSAHFTAVQVLSDATGAFTGTVTIDGYPTVSEDGLSFTDDAPESKLTVRDPTGTIVMVIGGDGSFPPVTATRMGVGSPGFPTGTPVPGTPAA